ncbi:MAG: FtsX-like permease family protein [candidate division Zixibacteria bacterium]|nr:FtsX-like permease family protein [candidate division Zixibacteria bacterium]
MTILTMFGGFTLAALAIGLADGTYAYVINMFTRNQLGHIQIHRESYLDRPSLYKTVDHYKTVGEAVGRISGVEARAPRLYSAGLVSLEDKSSTARIIGIDPVRENTATRFDKKIVEGRSLSGPAAHEVVIGRGLAKVLKARVADEVVVVSQAADGSIANDIYNIVGIAAAGDDMSDRTAFYLHLDDARELLVLEERVHEIIVIINNIDYVYKITGDIREKLADSALTVQPWQEFARSFYQAMQVDLQANLIMLLIINLIVAVGVLNTVLMTVLERTREYGVLKAMGTRPLMIFRLVVVEVAVMIVISLIIGFILSLIINYLLATTGIPMPFKFSYGGVEFTRWYSEVNARSLYIPGITVAVVALLVSIFPATRAARIAPADAMRTN